MEDFKRPIKLLFIGNSATYVHDIPQTLARLAYKAGYNIETTVIAKGGYTLSRHANSSTKHGQSVLDEIANGYDMVFLQDNGNCISSDRMRDAAKNACKALDEAIRSTGASTYIYVRPPYGTDTAGYTPFEQCIEFDRLFGEISKNINAENIYVNRAFAYAIKYLDYDLWGPDHAHVSEYGAYLTVCVFFSSLFHKTATLLEPGNLSAQDALALQKIADKIVLEEYTVYDF